MQYSFWSFLSCLPNMLYILNAVYNKDGVVEITRSRQVTTLEIPVRRAKGSQGDITVQWSVYQNDSSHTATLLWPTSGKISLADGEWNESFKLNIDNDKKKAPESVIWVQLDKTTGGAVLASRDQTTAKVLIAGVEGEQTWIWIVTGVGGALLLGLVIVILLWCARKRKIKMER